MAYEKVFYCCGVHIHYCWSFQNPWKEWNQFDSHLKQILIHCSNLEAKNESEPELWICSQHVNISPAFTFASNVDFWLRHIAFPASRCAIRSPVKHTLRTLQSLKRWIRIHYWLNFMSELWWVGWGFFTPALITVLSCEPAPLCPAYRFRNKQKVFPPLHRYCSSVVHKYNHLNRIMSIRWYWFSSLVFYIRKLAVPYLLLRLRPVSCTPVHLHASTSSPHHSPSLPGGAVYRVKLLARFCLCSVQTSSCWGSVWILRHLSLPLSAFPSTRSFLPGSISFPSQCRCFNKVC